MMDKYPILQYSNTPLLHFFFRTVKALLFTVNAAAVLLAIHCQILGCVDTFFPSRAKILIKKRYAHGAANGFANRFDPVMLLEFAVKQGRREIVELAPLGQQGGCSQAIVIAVVAAILFPVDDVLNKSFQIIAFLVDHAQIYIPGVGLHGFLTF